MILVTGATGMIGGALARRLAARGIPFRALVRQRAKADALAALPGVQIVEGDMAKPETLAEPLRGVTRAFLNSSAGPAMQDTQCAFVDAAAKAGVKHVVKISGDVADVESPFRFARMHALIERHLEASGVAYTHLRSCEFMHSYFRQAPNIIHKGALFLPMEDARIASIDGEDVAEAAAIALTGKGHENQIHTLTGPESLTMADVAEKLSAAVGKPVRYVNVPPEDAKKAQLAASLPPYMVDALAELYSERRKGVESRVYPTLKDVFGIEPTPFAQFAARNAAVFRG